MKTLITTIFCATVFNCISQISGMESYKAVLYENSSLSKQYVKSEDSYSMILIDDYDMVISEKAFDSVFTELERVFNENGIDLPKGQVIGREFGAVNINGTKQDILKAIKSKAQFICLEFEFKDDYVAVINLQDGFCALGFDKISGYLSAD